jgi:HAE1 family hydrophobic/amphiphilic exporter-1
MAQADSKFRMDPKDIKQLKVRNAEGTMIPIGTFAQVDEVLGPQTITRFNLYPAIKITGEAAPGFSSGQALQIMEDMSAKKLTSQMGFAWTDLSFQESAINPLATAMIFGFSILMVYLVLAAQYESWSIPVSVCLSVPTALLGAVLGLMSRGMTNNIYTQVGIVLIIGLASKNAILIVELASEKHEAGMNTLQAAVEASRERFRAILMTALSSILGFMPLVIASGAGAASRQAIGTAVVGGMTAAGVMSLIFTPVFYVVMVGVSEWLGKNRRLG